MGGWCWAIGVMDGTGYRQSVLMIHKRKPSATPTSNQHGPFLFLFGFPRGTRFRWRGGGLYWVSMLAWAVNVGGETRGKRKDERQGFAQKTKRVEEKEEKSA